MKDRVVIITGGSSGIGKALAIKFGLEGSKVVITGRSPLELEAAASELKNHGIEVLAVQADVTKMSDNLLMAERTLERFGRIDILINNAGISMRAMFAEVDLEVIRKVMEINFFGVLQATQVCMEEIRKNKGSVVGISSIAGFRGLPGRAGYSASKFALNGFLEVLRTEYLHTGVHILTACPGFTASNIRVRALTWDGSIQKESSKDESSIMSAEECAAHIYKAVVKRKKYLVLTNQGKLIVWINKWFPALADKLVYNAMKKEPDFQVKPK